MTDGNPYRVEEVEEVEGGWKGVIAITRSGAEVSVNFLVGIFDT